MRVKVQCERCSWTADSGSETGGVPVIDAAFAHTDETGHSLVITYVGNTPTDQALDAQADGGTV